MARVNAETKPVDNGGALYLSTDDTDLGSGIGGTLVIVVSWFLVDTRSSVFNVPAQEVLTKDSVTVAVDAVLYYRVSNVVAAVTNVVNAHASTKLVAQTTLRQALGQRNLHELLADRDAISNTINVILEEATHPWGIKVERVEITDVRLPKQMQRAMAIEGEAAREAKAKVIAAEGELKASRALREAADTLSESGAAIQLRYLQSLTALSTEKNNTVIFPLPISIMTQLKERWLRMAAENTAKKVEEICEAEDEDDDLP